MATLAEMLNNSSSSSSGGTSGTLSTQGLYTNPATSNQGLNGGTRGVANHLAYNRSVQPDGLVENRLNALTAGNSPYINQARTEARRFAGSRGLLNSSMSGAAGIEAAIRQGLPIAQADAGAINAAEAQNLDALNQNHMQVRQLMNEATIAAAREDTSRDAFTAGARDAAANRAHDLQLQRERLGYEGEQAGLNRSHEFGMLGYDYDMRNQMSDNDAYREDYLSNNNFQRDLYGSMVQAGFSTQMQSMADFRTMLNAYALDNPDVFNADNYTQIGSFMGQQTQDAFSQMFANWFGG